VDITPFSEWIDRHAETANQIDIALERRSLDHLSQISIQQWQSLWGAIVRSGITGSSLDGLIALLRAWPRYRKGRMSSRELLEYIGTETACGGISSASGGVVSEIIRTWTGKMGTLAVLSGIGTSVLVRHIYRELGWGPRLTDDDPAKEGVEFDSLEDELDFYDDEEEDVL
jgi:hypothetical protein